MTAEEFATFLDEQDEQARQRAARCQEDPDYRARVLEPLAGYYHGGVPESSARD